jgi:N-acetylglucosaminyldiphosphoundecaprenol N-acetyl-beta-D-mannosaminyltransferase
LRDLVANLTSDHASRNIVGVRSPPFRTLNEKELVNNIDSIAEVSPGVVWVGKGMPKQELWMEQARERLPETSLVGVGAVFDWSPAA